jgi:hypothetical protein
MKRERHAGVAREGPSLKDWLMERIEGHLWPPEPQLFRDACSWKAQRDA